MEIEFDVIRKNIDDMRKKNKWSKAELARRINIQPSNVIGHLKGNHDMSMSTLVKYAKAFGCSVADLVDGSEDARGFNKKFDVTRFYPYNVAFAMYAYKGNVPRDCIGDVRNKIAEKTYAVYIPGLLLSIKSLPERERGVIESLFKDELSVRSAGTKFHVSRTVICNSEHRAFDNLFSPQMRAQWEFAVPEKIDEIKKENRELRKEVENLRRKLDYYEAQIENTTTLIEMGLSNRSVHALSNVKIFKLSDFDMVSVRDITKIQSLGEKSVKEILDAIRRYGGRIENNVIHIMP